MTQFIVEQLNWLPPWVVKVNRWEQWRMCLGRTSVKQSD